MSRAWEGVITTAVVLATLGVIAGVVLFLMSLEPHRYAGDTRSEAKVITDRWVTQHYKNVSNVIFVGLTESRILGRDAWQAHYYGTDKGDVCIYTWWSDYHNDDYAVQGECR